MSTHTTIDLLILVILLLLSAFFSSAETALTVVNRIRMQALAEEGNTRAAKVIAVTDNRPKMLSAILICNNVINLSASALSTTLAIRVFGNAAVGLATGVLTVLVIIFGEIAPKNMAAVRSEEFALRNISVISFLMKVLTPVIFIVEHLAALVVRLFAIDLNEKPTMTENELRALVDASEEDGVIESDERAMINNVVDLQDTYAREIMIPRIDMISRA